MHGHKTALLRAHFGPPPENFHAISADLSEQSLGNILSAHPAFSADVATVFIAEGVLMYLREEDVRGFFAQMGRLCRLDVSLIFTAIKARRERKARKHKKLRDAILKASRERFGWSMDADKMPQFLVQQGWLQTAQSSYADLQRPYRTPEEMEKIERQNGEYFIAARRELGL